MNSKTPRGRSRTARSSVVVTPSLIDARRGLWRRRTSRACRRVPLTGSSASACPMRAGSGRPGRNRVTRLNHQDPRQGVGGRLPGSPALLAFAQIACSSLRGGPVRGSRGRALQYGLLLHRRAPTAQQRVCLPYSIQSAGVRRIGPIAERRVARVAGHPARRERPARIVDHHAEATVFVLPHQRPIEVPFDGLVNYDLDGSFHIIPRQRGDWTGAARTREAQEFTILKSLSGCRRCAATVPWRSARPRQATRRHHCRLARPTKLEGIEEPHARHHLHDRTRPDRTVTLKPQETQTPRTTWWSTWSGSAAAMPASWSRTYSSRSPTWLAERHLGQRIQGPPP